MKKDIIAAEPEKIRKLLKKLEWSGQTEGPPTGMGLRNGEILRCCPLCRGLDPEYLKTGDHGFYESAFDHQRGCELKRVLK